MPKFFTRCRKCGEMRPLTYYYVIKKTGKRYGRCKGCQDQSTRDYRLDPRRRLLIYSRGRAQQGGLPHTITLEDIEIPVRCPYLGIEIDYGALDGTRKWNHPSLDRIDSTQGYVPGNVQVISDLANRMKQNATIAQLLAFAEGVLRVHGEQRVEKVA